MPVYISVLPWQVCWQVAACEIPVMCFHAQASGKAAGCLFVMYDLNRSCKLQCFTSPEWLYVTSTEEAATAAVILGMTGMMGC